MRSPDRVLVLCEHGRSGEAAIDAARHLAESTDTTLTVVAVAPQAPSGSRCGNSATEFNTVVAESVSRDLDEARARLGQAANSTIFVLLVEGLDESLEQFVRSGGFARVVLPARHRPLRRGPYHPEARRLELNAGAEVRIVPRASGKRQPPQPAAGAGGS